MVREKEIPAPKSRPGTDMEKVDYNLKEEAEKMSYINRMPFW